MEWWTYQLAVRCPDASIDSTSAPGADRLAYAQVRSQPATDSGVYLPVRLDQGGKPTTTAPNGTVLKKEKGGPTTSTCPDVPAPNCTVQQQQQQLEQVQGFYTQTTAASLQNLSLPTTLYRVELCDGSFALLLQHQLDLLNGEHNVLGSLQITDLDQPITATLRGVNQLFALKLDYNPNGNIQTATWKTTYHAPNTYEYEYDPLNRLTSATYNPGTAPEGSGPADLFSVSGITYDGIGNIQTLNRMGFGKCKEDGSITFGSIDELVYGYGGGGSKLTTVTDNASEAEFKNQGVKPHSGSYSYDAAGRMTYDPHRDLTIAYNHLDLPRRIDGPGGVIEITYDATGRKWLQKKEKDATMYVGAFTFKKENGNTYLLEAANTGEGRIVYDKDNQQLFNEYFHKDHLGNIRLAFTDRNEDGKVELLGSASEITQQNDFYPFGMAHKGEGLFHGDLGSNRFKFNGIEQLEDIGLELAPFRSYDAAVGRWGQVDPIYKFNESGYASMTNNPINFADPMGLDTIPAGKTLPIVPVPGKRERNGPLPNAGVTPESSSPPSPIPTVSPQTSSSNENRPSDGANPIWFFQGVFRGYFQSGVIGGTGSIAVGIAISENFQNKKQEFAVYSTVSTGVFLGASGGLLGLEAGTGNSSLDRLQGWGIGVGAIIPWTSFGVEANAALTGPRDGSPTPWTTSGSHMPFLFGKSIKKGGGAYAEITWTTIHFRTGNKDELIDYLFSFAPNSLKSNTSFNRGFKRNMAAVLKITGSIN